jgi:DNA-binding transcriptional LysR family regulator
MRNQQAPNISLWMRTTLSLSVHASPALTAKLLGMNISTVYRHIDALEHSLGLSLFNRRRSGWELRKEVLSLVALGKKVESLLKEAENEIRYTAQVEGGNLRIALSDDFAAHYVAQRLKAFLKTYPAIQPELIVSNQFANLAQGAADVAIRPDMDPGDTLIGHKVGSMQHAFYASQDYVAQYGTPKSLAALKKHIVCGYGADIQNYSAAKWLDRNIPKRAIVARFGNTTTMTQAAMSGIGIGLLPCFVGDALPALIKVLKIKNMLAIDIWLVSTKGNQKLPKVRVFFDFFTAQIRADNDLFSGTRPRSQIL